MANTDYANANEASLQEYQALTAAIDLARDGRRLVRTGEDLTEAGQEAQRDKDVFPFAGKT